MMEAVKTDVHVINEAGDIAVTRHQNARPIFEFAHELRQTGNTGSSDMKLAATIPVTVIENYLARTGITWREFTINQEHIKRVLNDPDLKGFRVWEGKA